MMTTPDPCAAPTIVTIAEGLHVRQAVDNMGWTDMGDCALVVDALEQPDLEQEVFEAIRATLGDKPIRYVLNTHTHYDHIALNPAFERAFNAEVVNQRTAPLPPEGRWIEGARRRVQILPTPDCHTPEDCVVWAPEDKALFVGDIFGWGLIPYEVGLDAESAERLVRTYQRLIDFNASTVVPGHGPVCSTAELERWVEYFQWLQEQVRAACAAGKTDPQIAQEIAPPDDMESWWRFLQWKHGDSLTKILKALRQGRM